MPISFIRKDPTIMQKLFGQNYETTIGVIFTAIGLVPQAIQSLELTNIPQWLRVTGLICTFISMIYTGIMAKSKNVTGTGVGASRDDQLK